MATATLADRSFSKFEYLFDLEGHAELDRVVRDGADDLHGHASAWALTHHRMLHRVLLADAEAEGNLRHQ